MMLWKKPAGESKVNCLKIQVTVLNERRDRGRAEDLSSGVRRSRVWKDELQIGGQVKHI